MAPNLGVISPQILPWRHEGWRFLATRDAIPDVCMCASVLHIGQLGFASWSPAWKATPVYVQCHMNRDLWPFVQHDFARPTSDQGKFYSGARITSSLALWDTVNAIWYMALKILGLSQVLDLRNSSNQNFKFYVYLWWFPWEGLTTI